MREDVKIYLSAVQYKSTIPKSELFKVNLFNNNANDISGVALNKADITTLLMEDGLGEISYTTEITDNEKVVYDSYIYVGNVNIKLTNLLSINATLLGRTGYYKAEELLQFYEDTSYLKYLIQIYYKNKLIFEGTINNDSFETVKGYDNECEIISFEILSLEKEFKDYFSNIKLKDINLTGYWFENLSFNQYYYIRYDGSSAYKPKFIMLKDLLKRIFQSNNPLLPSFVTDVNMDAAKPPVFKRGSDVYNFNWIVSKQAHLFVGQGVGQHDINYKHTIWFNSGYDTFVNNYNCFEFLQNLCKCMGWHFSFVLSDIGNGNYIHMLTLKKRNSFKDTSTLISNDSLLENPYLKKQTSYDKIYDAVMPCGSYEDGYGYVNLNMYRAYVISMYNKSCLNRDSFFRAVRINGDNFYKDFSHYMGEINEVYLRLYNNLRFYGAPVPGYNKMYNFGKPLLNKTYFLYINGVYSETISIGDYYPSIYGSYEFCNLIKDDKNDNIIKLDYWKWDTQTLTERILNKEDILKYENVEGDKIKYIQVDSTGNNDTHKTDISGNLNKGEIIFCGNVGGMVGYFICPNVNADEWEILTYRDYANGFNAKCFYSNEYSDITKDTEFEDNFKILLNKNLYLTPEVRLKGINNNIVLTLVQFENNLIPQLNNKQFLVKEQKIDLINDITTLQLVNI